MLSEEWTGLEVPGMYVFRDESILAWEGAPEYRCALALHPVSVATAAYYRCWRTAPSEWARALYFVKHIEVPISS